MLLDGEPKPCKPTPMKNVEDIIKDTLSFNQYFDINGCGCWWIILPLMWNLDRLLDTFSFYFSGPSSR